MRRAKQTFRVSGKGREFMLYRRSYGEYKMFKGYSFSAEFGRDIKKFRNNPKRMYFSKDTPRNNITDLSYNLNYNFNLPWDSRNYFNYHPTI